MGNMTDCKTNFHWWEESESRSLAVWRGNVKFGHLNMLNSSAVVVL